MLQIIKVYGPYVRKQDKRKVVVLKLVDGSLTTQSYARFIYQQKHGKISENLTVDHIDEDCTNDVLENFQLLTRVDNIKKPAKTPELFNGICPICRIEFIKYMRNVRGNQGKQNKAGPFCSKKCAGIYNANKQYSFNITSAPIVID